MYCQKSVLNLNLLLVSVYKYLINNILYSLKGASLIAQLVKNPPAMQETPV